jgi:hypothetical protein
MDGLVKPPSEHMAQYPLAHKTVLVYVITINALRRQHPEPERELIGNPRSSNDGIRVETLRS